MINLTVFGVFGNETQKAEAKKVFDWKNDITAECMLRINNAMVDEEIQSLDYSEFDVTDPNVTTENILTL